MISDRFIQNLEFYIKEAKLKKKNVNIFHIKIIPGRIDNKKKQTKQTKLVK